jgi:hypothetical protein
VWLCWGSPQCHGTAPAIESRLQVPVSSLLMAISGIALDPNSRQGHCETCIYACTARKPVPLGLRVSEQEKRFSDEIHTEVWVWHRPWTALLRRFHGMTQPALPPLAPTFSRLQSTHCRPIASSRRGWAYRTTAAIKVLRSDRGGECLSGAFDKHLRPLDCATAHQL